MRKFMMALGCAAMVLPSVMATTTVADGQRRYRDGRDYNYREYRDNRGRVRCKKNNGTTGTIIGGVGGALLGRTIDTRGDRTLGTLGGAAAGALAGRAIDKGSSNDRAYCR